jgi:hypothetical protein
MIIANYAQQNRNCVREWGVGFTNPFAQLKPQLFHSFYTPDTTQADRDKSAFNHGYNTHSAWHLSPKSGGVASTLNLNGTGTLAASALAVKLAEAALSGDGTLTALGSLIVQAIAALSGSGDITDAQVNAFLAAVANISGSGNVTNANLTGLGAAVAAIFGSGTAAGSTASGIAEAIAALTVTGTGLSTANVGQAVWGALAAANNATGTMGEKLNDAGSASNPWTEVIDSGYTAAEIMRLLASVAAGSATGLDGTAVFKSLDGTKDRIESSITGAARTTNALDVS